MDEATGEARMKMYRATLGGIYEVDMHSSITEHVDAGTWEAYGRKPETAKRLLVEALEKRMQGALSSWEMARDRLAKAKELSIEEFA